MSDPAQRLVLQERGGAVELRVKVVPGASRTRVAGVWNGALRVQVAAPPEGGRANRQLVRFLGGLLGCKAAQVEIVAGMARPLKTVRIEGLSADRLRRALGQVLG